MEPNYSKRELDTYMADTKEHLIKQDGVLEKILAQVMKTNGRVNKLEWWKSALIWGFGTLVALAAPIGYIVKTEIENEVHNSITSTLDNYNITVNN